MTTCEDCHRVIPQSLMQTAASCADCEEFCDYSSGRCCLKEICQQCRYACPGCDVWNVSEAYAGWHFPVECTHCGLKFQPDFEWGAPTPFTHYDRLWLPDEARKRFEEAYGKDLLQQLIKHEVNLFSGVDGSTPFPVAKGQQ